MNGAQNAWGRFWFARTSTATLGVVRIAFGFVITLWALSLMPDLPAFFGHDGMVPSSPHHAYWIGLLSPSASAWVVYAVWAALLVAAVSLMVGYRSRLAAVVVFVCILSFERRDPYVFDAGDLLLRNLGLLLALAPSGAALSIDAFRRSGRALVFPPKPQWPIRLMQLQIVALYAETVWAKLHFAPWRNGTAVSYAMRLDWLVRFHAPGSVTRSSFISAVLTYATLAIEASLVVLVWHRRTRWWALGAGVLLHLGIAIGYMLEFFTLAILIGYLAFVPPDTMERLIERVSLSARRTARGSP